MINSNGINVENKNEVKEEEKLKPINSLKFTFKTHEYYTTRDILIPFNLVESNYGKFHTAFDAMLYIRDHCYRNSIAFKRATALKYSKLCQYYDQSKGSYVCMERLTASAFNRVFSRVCNLKSTKILKFI
ncbi:hypothetical protein TVAG_281200 [Trichomonas vaginalis G3]|uniref:Uncharacterized protein n=1 Tax=Trichomonas vaginalis (strain ATCC PRA-98 / G3) TaxID=412133 RepID=A2DRP0_TRIV3|nr:hypothetical protein TVAGG3_0696390 [Trichomonas vaginalis G3]EAY17003.1 hypothetical protein TVAG_281200 [Trichomonas vaginalis G3]KAI5508944.1 hypothetical protein TVAGG3_0696390 [Trichomonas vaginalis G3]|eukprot:XP_001329226.1 hypothetical protein [Trichomonas vaginalis G3]